ncbi:GSCOCG00007125001-RA-CDS [Cotesia congregata]|nr:GSCOCG00007125001-RA-CDS [Cotesia congregata]
MCRHTYNTYIYMYIYLFGKFSHVVNICIYIYYHGLLSAPSLIGFLALFGHGCYVQWFVGARCNSSILIIFSLKLRKFYFKHLFIFCSEAKRRPVITCDLRHFLLYCARYVIYYYTFSLLVKVKKKINFVC